MGASVSRSNTPGTSSGINLNGNNMATELSSYMAECNLDSDLQSFVATLQTRTNQVINTIAAGVEVGSLSLNSQRQVIECLLDISQEVVKVILDCKQDISNEKELSELVEEYFDSSLETLKLYRALKKCLQRARNSQLPLLVALQHFDEDTEKVGNSRYARTLQGLKKFKADGDPFTEELFQIYQSVYEQQKLMLEKLMLRKNKVDKKLKYIYLATVAAVLIPSVVAAAVASSHVAGALSAATEIPIGSVGKWIYSLLKNYENALKGQKEVINAAKGGTYVAKTELDDIRVLINGLKDQIESLMENVDFAIEQEAVKVAIEEIKKKLGDFMKDAEDLGVQADKCSRDVLAARKEVLQRIKKPPHT